MNDFPGGVPPPLNDPSQLRVGPKKKKPFESLMKSIGGFGVAILVFFAKFKGALIGLIKLLPVILKSGGTMLISIGVYAMFWGWRFAVGFVVLIFIHECGHLVVARKFGLKVSAPMFIPFLGAYIALKDQPKNAWMEAWVGIGGPIFGALGSAACIVIYQVVRDPMYLALAWSGFWLNLFNLLPLGQLDGGRIVVALSPWLWIVGMAILGFMLFVMPSFMLILILILSLPRLISLFRKKTDEEKRYFEVTPAQRLLMGVLYFGLAVLLVVGMEYSHIPVREP